MALNPRKSWRVWACVVPRSAGRLRRRRRPASHAAAAELQCDWWRRKLATIATAQRQRGRVAGLAARVHERYLQGRNYVVPEDVRSLAPDVLRHRLVLTFEAEAEDVTSDAVIAQLLGAVPAP